jgi:hypothetical protein
MARRRGRLLDCGRQCVAGGAIEPRRSWMAQRRRRHLNHERYADGERGQMGRRTAEAMVGHVTDDSSTGSHVTR